MSGNSTIISSVTLPLDNESVTTFVDYIQPPTPKPPPPAKYKLWLIILVLVYFANWFSIEANFTEALQSSGWLSPTAALFIKLATIVFVLVFATLDLVVAAFTFKFKGHVHGLGPWLKSGRASWIRKQHNLIAEIITCVIQIFEDGFEMFNATPLQKMIDEKEEFDESDEFTCPSGDCKVVLKVQHLICPSKINEYNKFQKKIATAASRHARGLVDLKNDDEMEVIHEEIYDEEQGVIGKSVKGKLHTIYLTFENIDYLNQWMISDRRTRLIKELQPLLVEPDIVKIRKDRNLPDAFTDLLIRQGEPTPLLNPKKWKVWWLTTLGLFFTQLWTRDTMPFYFEKWGLDTAHPRLQELVSVTLSTYLNSYVMTPLLLYLFSDWLRRKVDETDTKQPWKTANDGFESLWTKSALTIAMYGGFVLAWALQ